MKKTSRVLIIAVITMILIAACTPNPGTTKKDGLNVPSWLIGTWESETITVTATSDNIILIIGNMSVDLKIQQDMVHWKESTSATSYSLSYEGSGYSFTKTDGGIRFTIMSAGMMTHYDLTK